MAFDDMENINSDIVEADAKDINQNHFSLVYVRD
jgi:hypothetical protein